jgi:hypothetical protein
MNTRRGFFRLTLVLSILCGILTVIFGRDIFSESRIRYIQIRIPLPNDWENKTFQEKLNIIDEILILEKKDEKRKQSGTPEEAMERLDRSMFLADYSKLTSTEQQNVKRRLREQIISDEKRSPKDREKRDYYYVSFGPDWKELSFLVFIRLIIGSAPVWLIYAFTRWIIFGFIVGGFKAKSLKGGEREQPPTH